MSLAVGRRQQGDQRDAARLRENVMFRPALTAIGWVRSSFFPPRSARSEALSTRARARSSWPRRATRRAGPHGAGARRRPAATGPVAASRCCPSHTPFRAAACATAGHSARRTGCRSARPDPGRGSAGPVAAAASRLRQQRFDASPQSVVDETLGHGRPYQLARSLYKPAREF